jgi:hypothetical protein
MRLFLALAFLLLAVGAAHAACPSGDVERAGAAVRQARAELKAIHVDQGWTDVSPRASLHIERVKDRLRTFVAAVMACAPEAIDVKALGAKMSAKGHARAPADTDGDGHGLSLTYDVKAITGHPDLVGFKATLGIECGEDTLLMLYQRQGRDWREVLVHRNAPYKDVSGAGLNFQYAVSPNDAQGRWYVATLSVPPWCSSAWRGIRYDLSRPGPQADRPHVFFSRSDGAYLGNDDGGQIEAEAAQFEIRHEVGSIDFDVFTRKSVRRYSVMGDVVARIPPVALNDRDFVDEWIVSPWSEADKWSASGLAAVHARLAALNKENGSTDNSFGSMRSCGSGARQVELTLGKTATWFFQVAEGPPFQMRRVSQRPNTACTGPLVPIDKP